MKIDDVSMGVIDTKVWLEVLSWLEEFSHEECIIIQQEVIYAVANGIKKQFKSRFTSPYSPYVPFVL